MTTPPAKAGGFLRRNVLQQRLLRLRMSYRSTLAPEGPVRAYWVTRSLSRFKSYLRDCPAQPPNLKLLRRYVTSLVVREAKVERSLPQKGVKRHSAVA